MSGLAVFTMAHAVISCLALATGLMVCVRMLTHRASGGWPRNFFVLAFATSTSGFFFPITELKPSHLIGVVSLFVLGLTLRGYYVAHQHGTWRAAYRAGVVASTYLLALVAVNQALAKIPSLWQMSQTAHSNAAVVAHAGLLALAAGAFALSFRHPPGYRVGALR